MRWINLCGAMWASLALVSAMPSAASAACKMVDEADIPIVVKNHRLLIPGEINDKKVFFIFDTGAGVSLLFANSVSKLGLPTHNVWNAHIYGVGGEVTPRLAHIEKWKLGNFAMKGGDVYVGNAEGEADDDIAGLIGYDIFARRDMEFDLAHGMVRLIRPIGCQDEDMAYWAQSYVVAPLVASGQDQHSYVTVRLNGVPMTAILDTGSPSTIIAVGSARNAGVRPTSPGVHELGETVGGVGGYRAVAWMAAFKTFELGQEKIGNPNIEMADMYAHDTYMEIGSNVPHHVDQPSMIVGLDFFSAHHMLISRERGKIYFSYDGGPIFQAPPSDRLLGPSVQEKAAAPNGKAAAATPGGR